MLEMVRVRVVGLRPSRKGLVERGAQGVRCRRAEPAVLEGGVGVEILSGWWWWGGGRQYLRDRQAGNVTMRVTSGWQPSFPQPLGYV